LHRPNPPDRVGAKFSHQKTVDIYVGNLPYTCSEDELAQAFAQFGEVSRTKIVMDRESGRSKGFGFVTMRNDEDTQAAVAAMNGASIGERPVTVRLAYPRDERSPRSASGRHS
jgi:RNA recognition motif-containing protein